MWNWIMNRLVPELAQIEKNQQAILSAIAAINNNQTAVLKAVTEGFKKMSKEMDDLTSAVAKQTTVVASAVTLIQGLAKQIADSKDDPAAIEALAAQLNLTADDLAAAVTANTPATPAV